MRGGSDVHPRRQRLGQVLRAGDAAEITGGDMATQLGKRYTCTECNSEVLITKAGEGELECCGKAMELQQPRPLPSSD